MNTAVINNTTATEEMENQFFEANDTAVEIAEDKTPLTTMEKILAIRYFVPALSTIGFLACFLGQGIAVISTMGVILMAIGFISAMTVCPLKLMGFPLKCVARGFSICRGFIPVYGVADLCAAIFGTVFGAMFGLGVVLILPEIFTIKKFFAE